MCEEYNGWSNRETWAVNLWVNNDEALLELAKDYTITALQEHREDNEGEGGDLCDARNCLAESFEYWITEDLLTLENIAGNQALFNMLTDIGSLYRINWREMADSFVSDQVQELERAK
jgi:hypothetical protein